MTRCKILERFSNITNTAEAKTLLNELALLEQTPTIQAAVQFLIHNIFRTLNGETAKKIDRKTDLLLFHPFGYKPRETNWNDWMTFFGTKTAYVRVDADQGPVLQEQLPKTAEAAKERKAGVHFAPFLFGEEPTPGHKTVRSRDNVRGCLTFFADFDGDKAEDWEKIQQLAPLPSIVVETKRGWHVYWPLQSSVSVPAWEKVQSTIVEVTASDKAIKTPGHSLRMPSSWHCKGEPYYVQVVWADWHRFSYEEMEIAFPPKPTDPVRIPNTFRPMSGIRLPRTNSLPTGASHDTLVSESGRVYAGVEEGNAMAARNMVVTWFTSFKDNKKPTDEREAQRRCDELEVKQYGRVVSR